MYALDLLAVQFLVFALVAGASTCVQAQRPPAAVVEVREAQQFLQRYASLTATSDVAALDLYRDDARVRAASYAGDRETQSGVVRGVEWKRQLRAGWYDGTTRLEASSFQAATVVSDGERLVIRAHRYSQTGCYWDNGYAVAIAPDRNGQYQIVEERISFQRASSCGGLVARAAATVTAPVAIAGTPRAAQAAAAAAPRSPALPSNVFPIGQGAPRPNLQAAGAPGTFVQP